MWTCPTCGCAIDSADEAVIHRLDELAAASCYLSACGTCSCFYFGRKQQTIDEVAAVFETMWILGQVA